MMSKRKVHSDLCGYPHSPCSCVRGKVYGQTALHLRDLRHLDVENLACGRITNYALREACKRAGISIDFTTSTMIADELNDMLEAAKVEARV